MIFIPIFLLNLHHLLENGMTLQNQRLLATIFLIPTGFVAVFLIYSYLTRFQPDTVEILQKSNTPDSLKTNTTYRLIVWNIHHAKASFDSTLKCAEEHKTTKWNILENLKNISELIVKEHSSFSMLQEVDFYSKQSFFINQVQSLVENTSSFGFFASNHRVSFYPFPLPKPAGKINSGILTLSRFTPTESKRVKVDEPTGLERLFTPHNCLIENYFPVDNGKIFILINTFLTINNSQKGFSELKNYIEELFQNDAYVILGGCLVSYGPGNQNDSQQRALQSITPELADFVPKGWHLLTCGKMLQTNHLNGTNKEEKIDKKSLFLIASPNIKLTSSLKLITNNKPLECEPIAINLELI